MRVQNLKSARAEFEKCARGTRGRPPGGWDVGIQRIHDMTTNRDENVFEIIGRWTKDQSPLNRKIRFFMIFGESSVKNTNSCGWRIYVSDRTEFDMIVRKSINSIGRWTRHEWKFRRKIRFFVLWRIFGDSSVKNSWNSCEFDSNEWFRNIRIRSYGI